MPKIPYYVTSGGKPKFKRAVPADLVSIVGKKYWTKGAAKFTGKALVQQGHMFALFTEREIERLRSSDNTPPVDIGLPVQLELSDQAIKQVLAHYRADRENARIMDRSYFDTGERPANELIADAKDEVSSAILQAQRQMGEIDLFALRQLAKYGQTATLPPDFKDRDLAPGVLASLHANQLFQQFCRLLEIEEITLAQKRLDALTGLKMPTVAGYPAGNTPEISTQPGLSSVPDIKLKDLTDAFLKTKPADLTRSRMLQLKQQVKILHDWFGSETPVADIVRARCIELAEFLPKVPSNFGKFYPGLNVREAVEAHSKNNGVPADRAKAAEKTITDIAAVFRVAVNEGWLNKNPWDGIKIPRQAQKKYLEADRGYQPYPIASLNKLFGLPLFKGIGGEPPTRETLHTHSYWAPTIALYSGMRMNEILQLEKVDIQPSSRGGNYVFLATDQQTDDYKDTGTGKRLKTRTSFRRVPIHPFLIEAGFLDFVNSRDPGRLFPEASSGESEKPSDLYTKRFRTVAENAGVWVKQKQVFHSFRNNFTDALRAGGTSEELREAINGWDRGKSMDARYGKGHADEKLYDEVKKVEYPGFDNAHLIENAKYFKS